MRCMGHVTNMGHMTYMGHMTNMGHMTYMGHIPMMIAGSRHVRHEPFLQRPLRQSPAIFPQSPAIFPLSLSHKGA